MNNINKRIRPSLVDPKITSKLVRTLKKPEGENWKPVKNLLQTFYADWIVPHWVFFACLGLFIIFLLYRYRTIQNQKMEYDLYKGMGLQPHTDQSDYDKLSKLVLEAYKHQDIHGIEPRVKILPKHADRMKWYGFDHNPMIDDMSGSESDSVSDSDSPAVRKNRKKKKKRSVVPPAYKHLNNWQHQLPPQLQQQLQSQLQPPQPPQPPAPSHPSFAYPMYPYVSGGTLLPAQQSR